MFQGRFYSRIMGWEGGILIKCFHSQLFETSHADLEGKSGKEIQKIPNIEKGLFEYAKIHNDWYFYYGEMKMITHGSLD